MGESKNKKYSVSIPYHATVYLEINANNREQVLDKLANISPPILCFHCAQNIELGEENDAFNIYIEEIK